MRKFLFILLSLLCTSGTASAADGVINIPSDFSVSETANRLEEILKEKGMSLFNRIEHSAAAANIGIPLRDTELVIFGNPKAGSPLMQCQQSVAIDLPQKILIWKDEKSRVWLSYNDPGYLVTRHRVVGCDMAIAKVKKVLAGISQAAASR